MADPHEPTFPSVITPRLSRVREMLDVEASDDGIQDVSGNKEARGEPDSSNRPEMQWGQWANWASWTKIA
jgi:hypothetical protein